MVRRRRRWFETFKIVNKKCNIPKVILKSNPDPEGDGNGDRTEQERAINNPIGSADDGDG